MANKRVFIGTGRRKSSVAQVKMVPGKGKITVNGVDVKDYFPYDTNVSDLSEMIKRYKEADVWLETPYIEEELFNTLTDLLKENNLIKEQVNYNDLVNNLYV